jgi:S1-C subfamily serine protease
MVEPAPLPVDSLLLAAARIATFEHQRPLTNASGFFFERDERLYLVTSRHVLIDKPTKHHPNRIEIEIHTHAGNLARVVGFSAMLYVDGRSVWKQARDGGGEVDVAVLEIDRAALPAGARLQAFTPDHLQSSSRPVDIGSSLLILGFPLGFQDTLHRLPVVRHAVVSSAFGLRFQGHGYFLTDARTHRGISGAAVVMRDSAATGPLPWKLLGVHSARLDMATRDLVEDESLGLNCAWYADILMTLTEPPAAAAA